MRLFLDRLPRPLLLALVLFLSPRVSQVSALEGDSWCGYLMCVRASVDGETVAYELTSLNQLGWMAIGFGEQMANSPMVIVWHANGKQILSQRQASGHAEPQAITHPPRLATLSQSITSSPNKGSSPVITFEIPRGNDTVQSLIWAFGITTPAADPAAVIEQHLDAGTFSLDLTKQSKPRLPSGTASTDSQAGTHTSMASTATPPAPSQSATATPPVSSLSHPDGPVLVAHAALSAAGFLILLPLGALLARWSRVFTPKWFIAHWFVNVVLGLPFICVGWALGPLAVAQQGREHIVTTHQICGVVLFVLYIIEAAQGTVIHVRRPKGGRSHPARNVIHVVLGLIIFGLSVYETVNGVDRDSAVGGASQTVVVVICISWAVVFAATYGLGLLLFLRRQLAQERLGWDVPASLPLPMTITPDVRLASTPDAESASARRRARALFGAPNGPMADDGTHDVFSEPWATNVDHGGSSREGEAPVGIGTGQGEARTVTEMRQVQVVPVSLSALLPRS